MISFVYRQSQADHTSFTKAKGNEVTALIVYIDDIVITGNNDEEISNLKVLLAAKFETKDLGPFRYFLRIEVARSNRGIFIFQRKYVLDLFSEIGMLGCKLEDAPMEVNHQLSNAMGDSLLIKSSTKDLTTHLNAVYCILRYLKSAPGRGILYSNQERLKIEAINDVE
ncbi:uncharacterized mitochondrial protein AtMg00810-like [Macadamia integrifolia]|uniref:uncharacterized mitochondrial protein AtMg00810-like n=1 Tax=Macadamia integrifolia TaxID=60698 RepID=UPI001C4F169B|nr:uncharacterized mitochondrial protein AtMg00810-like [Macadamia integrifolia]